MQLNEMISGCYYAKFSDSLTSKFKVLATGKTFNYYWAVVEEYNKFAEPQEIFLWKESLISDDFEDYQMVYPPI